MNIVRFSHSVEIWIYMWLENSLKIYDLSNSKYSLLHSYMYTIWDFFIHTNYFVILCSDVKQGRSQDFQIEGAQKFLCTQNTSQAQRANSHLYYCRGPESTY